MRSLLGRSALVPVGMVLAGLLGLPAARAEVPDSGAAGDPPARVGRLSLIDGAVSFHAAGQDQWSAASLNYPVSGGTAFWTQPGARDEIRIGDAAVRQDGGTELAVDRLDDQTTALSLPQGSVDIDLPSLADGQPWTVETPRGTARLTQPGRYRVDAGTAAGPTRLVVFRGAGQIAGPAADLDVRAGETGLAGGADQPVFAVDRQAAATSLDQWAEQRDRALQPTEATRRYLPAAMTGAEDLDGYGAWTSDPGYGAVWRPRAVAADWAPYRDGHWAWVAPWGWTWVDDEPWGFAPFHYGRWVHFDDGWGWTPGVVVERPVYAPALVAFVGGTSLSLSIGGPPLVGWCPLAPDEPYRPAYHVSETYIRNVNVTNVRNVEINRTVNVTNVTYVNQRFATVVPQSALAAGRPVARAAVALPAAVIARAATAVPASAPPAPAPTALRAAGASAPGPAIPPALAGGPGRPADHRAQPVPRQALALPAPGSGRVPPPIAPGPQVAAADHRPGLPAAANREPPAVGHARPAAATRSGGWASPRPIAKAPPAPARPIAAAAVAPAGHPVRAPAAPAPHRAESPPLPPQHAAAAPQQPQHPAGGNRPADKKDRHQS